MKMEMQEVRNRKGTLLFKAMRVKDNWYVLNKNHNCYTLIKLRDDGSLETLDYEQEVRL